MLVQVTRQDLAATKHGDVALHQMAPQAVSGVGAWTFEAMIVLRVGVADVDRAAHGIHNHIEENRADSGEEPARSGLLDRRVSGRIDHEHIFIRQREIYGGVPNCISFILPVHLAVRARAIFHNQSGGGRGNALVVGVRRRRAIVGNGAG